MHRRSHLLLLGATLTAGCADGMADESYPGKPLALVKGEVRAAPGAALAGDLSLAILWAPRLDATPRQTDTTELFGPPPMRGMGGPSPRVRVTTRTEFETRWISQAVSYRPVFPFRFELPIRTVPPAEAQQDLGPLGGAGRIATGVLVAYEDLDGDGRFTQGTPATPGDRVVASSWHDRDPAAPSIMQTIVFLDGTLPPAAVNQAGIIRLKSTR